MKATKVDTPSITNNLMKLQIAKIKAHKKATLTSFHQTLNISENSISFNESALITLTLAWPPAFPPVSINIGINAVRIVFESKVKLTIIPCKNVASNLRTSIYELNHYLKDKSELCNYLIDRFYNDGYHGIQERRVIWDISVIAYLINKDWFTSNEISCPNIKDDTSYELTTDSHKITMVNYIDVNKVYNDLFRKLGDS